jgi:hypothetical protein
MKNCVIVVLLLASFAFSVDTKKEDVPALDKDKIIAIKDLQLQNTRLIVQMQQLQVQFSDLQRQNAEVTNNLNKALSDAQDEIDKTRKKWILNQQTLKPEPVTGSPSK